MARAGKMKLSNIVVWILLGLLIIGLAGFGIGDFGGSVRSVGKVGEREIETDDYARALQNQLAAFQQQTGQNLGMAQARALGLDRMVLESLVTAAALDNEAEQIGLSAGDAAVAARLRDVPAFQGLNGGFDRASYEFMLDRSGLTPAQFEERLRDEIARDLLREGVTAAIAPPAGYAERLVAWLAEERVFEWAQIGPGSLEQPVPAPTEAQLRAWHAENPEPFTAPETRRITYVWLTPDMMLDRIEIDEAALRELYEARAGEYNLPERRILDRLVMRDTAAAEAARAAIAAGETDFDALVAARDLAPEDVDLGEVARTDLEPAVAEAVFAQTGPGIVGPVETPLGPALFRVNAALNAVETPLDAVRDELARELTADRAGRLVEARMDEIEDLLAGGATLEEVAAETPMVLGEIAFNAESTGGIADYTSFRTTAEAAEPGDFPELQSLSDGGLFALRLDGVVPPELRPFETVRAEVAAAWTQAETARRVAEQAEALRARLAAGEDFDALGLTAETAGPLRRNDRLGGAPRSVVERAFALPEGGTGVLTEGTSAWLIALDSVRAAGPADPEVEDLVRAVRARARLDIAEDVFALYSRALRETTPISLNATALQAVQAQMP